MRNKHPAELARGLVFQENFENAADIAKNGGVITGALEFRDKGAYFDGTNDYITYPAGATGQPFSALGFSVVLEFTPNFDIADGGQRGFFAETSGIRLQGLTNGAIRFLCSGISFVGGPGVNWKRYQRNVLVVSCRSGTQTMWLNGVPIGAGTSSFTPLNITTLFIGVYETGIVKFEGTFHSIKFFKHYAAGDLLTAQEALDYYTGQTFNYDKRATCILPMTADCHDATNLRTLDVSGKGNHFNLGDGVTASTFPTKLQKRGYSLDGGDYFKKTFVLSSGVYSVVTMVRKTTNTTKYVYDFRGSGAGTGIGYYEHTGGNLTFVGGGTTNIDGKVTRKYKLGVPEVLVHSGGTLGVTDYAIIAASKDAVSDFDGEMYYFALYPFALTPLQILDITLKLKKTLNLT